MSENQSAYHHLGSVIVDLQSTELSLSEESLLKSPQVGGLILFSRNYTSRSQLTELLNSVRMIRPSLLVMVDQEGGRVQRFRSGFTRLPPLQRLGVLYASNTQKALQLAYNHAWVMATELISVGVDISLGPVLDVDDSFSDVIGDRSFAPSVDVVTALAEAYMQGMNDAGMQATAKHFPGHGAVKQDSHKALPVDARTLEDVMQADMQPFIRLKKHYKAIMPAHIVFEQVDQNPVGFSVAWLQNILRADLGFEGVIFSDDLSMEGAAVAGDYCARADAALNAGCDAILVCNTPAQAQKVVRHLEQRRYASSGLLQTLRAQNRQIAEAAMESDVWRQRVESLIQLEV